MYCLEKYTHTLENPQAMAGDLLCIASQILPLNIERPEADT